MWVLSQKAVNLYIPHQIPELNLATEIILISQLT